jgi:hypothetical protein
MASAEMASDEMAGMKALVPAQNVSCIIRYYG